MNLSLMSMRDIKRHFNSWVGMSLLAGASLAASMAQAQELTPVRLRLDWTTLGYHAPFYYGAAKGIYEKAGIKLEIEEGKGSASVTQLAASGADDFGFADATTVAQLVAKGLPAKVVMGVLRGTTIAMFYADGRGINAATDMKGRKISVCPGDAISVYIPAYFKSVGIDAATVEQFPVDCSLKYTVVAQGRADGVMTYATAGKPLLQKVGIKEPGRFKAGSDFYLPSHGIVASEKMIKEKPEVVRRFVAATAQAWAAAMKDPDGAVDAIIAARPLLKGDAATIKETFVTSLDFLDSPSTKGKAFGYQSPEDWQKALDILQEYAGMPKTVKADAIYTNAFVAP
ncbi:ABC transporter substrate-binding protein [soil metagenome]